MSKMVSLYEGIYGTRLEGYILSNGEIHHNFIRNNRNTGEVETAKLDKIKKDFRMTCKFDEEEIAKDEYEIFGRVLDF